MVHFLQEDPKLKPVFQEACPEFVTRGILTYFFLQMIPSGQIIIIRRAPLSPISNLGDVGVLVVAPRRWGVGGASAAARQRGFSRLGRRWRVGGAMKMSGCWCRRAAGGGGGRTRQSTLGGRGARDKGGSRGGGSERGEPLPPSRSPSRLRRPLRSRRWTLSFGGEDEVAAMTATAMSSRWLQRERAVDSTMRVGGGRMRRQ